ncbi:MAG TPA: hypothetical protein DDZ80_18320, partial [Cyanobacteria bacterium UBA8803]|nr:hypothetical protein [Cyanobacteria bacterium UBA8803]
MVRSQRFGTDKGVQCCHAWTLAVISVMEVVDFPVNGQGCHEWQEDCCSHDFIERDLNKFQ